MVILIKNTAKTVYNDNHWNPKIMAVVNMWSLFNGHLYKKMLEFELQNSGGCYFKMVHSLDLALAFIC